MAHFTDLEPLLFYSLPLSENERKKIDAFLLVLEKSNAWKYLNELNPESEQGRPRVNPYRLFSAVLYCFALGKASLREIETACQTDIRLIYLMGDSRPSASTFSRFISSLIPKFTLIFSDVMKCILSECNVSIDNLFLDGSKFEANANKYKFVWRPTTFQRRLSDKTLALLKILGIEGDIKPGEIIPSRVVMQKISEAHKIDPNDVVGGAKALQEMKDQLTRYLVKFLEYEDKQRICGENRNSYFKTDHDATAMCLKADYYAGLGSHMHAAYNTQILVSNGFVLSYYLSQDCADSRTLIPTIEGFYKSYGRYPKKLCADAGYGSFTNYEYCELKGIEAFIKYTAWNGECTGRNPAYFEYLEDDTIRCLGGKIGVRQESTDGYALKNQECSYLVKSCRGCKFKLYCRRALKDKTGNSRIFKFNPRWIQLKQQARDRLLTPEGIEMRVNRSCQVEGAFGILKKDMQYVRFRRRSLDRVGIEFGLTCLGMNIRKYLRFSASGNLPFYWVAPDDLSAETFRKPSAKRIANRLSKPRKMQPNEIARKSYRKKGKY